MKGGLRGMGGEDESSPRLSVSSPALTPKGKNWSRGTLDTGADTTIRATSNWQQHSIADAVDCN